MNLTLFTISLILYFTIHSTLAAEKIRQWLCEKILPEKFYRLFFNAVALLGMIALTAFYFLFEKQVLINQPFVKWAGALMAIAGLYWVVNALRGYNLSEFAGLDQIKKQETPSHTTLKTSGLNAHVRHPLYFGTLLIIWGMFLIFPYDAALSIALVTTLYTYIGTLLEERKLGQQFGDAYRLYQREVPMLVPFRLKSK